MHIKSLVKLLAPHGLYEYVRKSNHTLSDPIKNYYKNGRVPFSVGYLDAKNRYISDTLTNLCDFSSLEQLPFDYGHSFDERVVEYPWIFSELNHLKKETFLDVGPCLNYDFLLDKLLKDTSIEKITFLSLTPDKNCFYSQRVSYVLEDVRSLTFIDNCFDVITCISTIEHIGMDNSKYNATKESSLEDYKIAISQMKRVLKPGGSLLLTVPFGKYENFGWFQQFDQAMVEESINVFSPSKFFVSYYQYVSSGWITSDVASCSSSRYNPSLGYRQTHNFEPGKAVCASAIACISLTK